MTCKATAGATDFAVYALTQGKEKKIVETKHFSDKLSAETQACTFVMQGYIAVTLENPEQWAEAYSRA